MTLAAKYSPVARTRGLAPCGPMNNLGSGSMWTNDWRHGSPSRTTRLMVLGPKSVEVTRRSYVPDDAGVSLGLPDDGPKYRGCGVARSC
jgi:hypothetical protein